MTEEKHIIRKLVLELHLPSADDAFRIQTIAFSFLKENILPIIEKIVEEFVQKNEVVRIDKLELDFENFIPEQKNEEGLRKFEEHIREKIIELIQKERSENFADQTLSQVTKISSQESDEELFFYLLKNGSRPWWAKTDEPISLETIAEKALQNPSATFKSELVLALKNQNVRKRIVTKLPFTTVNRILYIVKESPEILIQQMNVLAELIEKNIPEQRTLETLYELVFKFSNINRSHFEFFLSSMLKKYNDLAMVEKMYLANKTVADLEIATILKQGIADTNEHFKGEIKKMFVEEDQVYIHQKSKEIVEEEQEILLPEQTGDYFIKNSGVIILAPYLPQLFNALGLVNGKSFNDTTSKERAVYLLQYLAIGQTAGFEEHEMILNKILCGFEISEPLTLQFTITEKEKEECLNLLQAVADNWQALKGTSGEGMRDAFFMRDGILEQQQNGWNLKIEKTTIDILLDKLPWGISIIQMPWMEELIFVEW